MVVDCGGLVTEPAEMGAVGIPPLTSFPCHCGANVTKVILPERVTGFYKRKRYLYIIPVFPVTAVLRKLIPLVVNVYILSLIIFTEISSAF